jgi:hypothetical protein
MTLQASYGGENSRITNGVAVTEEMRGKRSVESLLCALVTSDHSA